MWCYTLGAWLQEGFVKLWYKGSKLNLIGLMQARPVELQNLHDGGPCINGLENPMLNMALRE